MCICPANALIDSETISYFTDRTGPSNSALISEGHPFLNQNHLSVDEGIRVRSAHLKVRRRFAQALTQTRNAK
jgi:hypothetical protein